MRFIRQLIDKGNAKHLITHSIYKNMVTLASGQVVAKIIGILAMPIITRIYLPEDYGIMTIFVSILTFMLPIATLGYLHAIPLPKNERYTVNLVFLCFIIQGLTSIIVIILFWVIHPALYLFFPKSDFDYWWFLLPAFFGLSLYNILHIWAIRNKEFRELSKIRIRQSIFSNIIRISIGLLGYKTLGLLGGQIFSQLGGTFTLLKLLAWDIKEKIRWVTIKRMIVCWKRHMSFPVFRLPSEYLLVFASQLITPFFAWRFGMLEVGSLGFALIFIGLPMNLVGQSTGHAYYSEIARLGVKDSKLIFQITVSVCKRFMLIALPLFLILFFFSPRLFELLFGNEWRTAGIYTSILSVYMIPQLIYAPIGNGIINVYGRQKLIFKSNMIRLSFVLGAFFVAYQAELTVIETLWTYSILSAIYFIIMSLLVLNIVRSHKFGS